MPRCFHVVIDFKVEIVGCRSRSVRFLPSGLCCPACGDTDCADIYHTLYLTSHSSLPGKPSLSCPVITPNIAL